jgi:hypothetical protein
MREEIQAAKLLAKFYAGPDQFALAEHPNQTLSIARNGEFVMVWPAAAQDDCAHVHAADRFRGCLEWLHGPARGLAQTEPGQGNQRASQLDPVSYLDKSRINFGARLGLRRLPH